MSKTIKIPEGFGNPVSIMLNGRKYTYTAGSTETVPDEVAALLQSNDLNSVIYGRRATSPLEAPDRKGDTAGVAAVVDDEGNIYVPAEGIAKAALSEIYVEGHKLIIPSEE